MCDKKNSVLFTDTECVVLSPDFKLTNESHVLLKVPKKDNMYSVDLKNVVPQGGLTCLFAKATLDESNLWHRRLGHINFKLIGNLVRGSGLEWLFDIDTLTKSMNYKPVVAGNQSNGNAGTKACDDTGEEEKKDAEDSENKDSEVPSIEEPRVNQENDANINSTNNINTVSPTVNAASIKDSIVDDNIVYGCADDPNMPNLEEIVYSDDDEDVGAEADMTNLDKHILVSPIPTTRIHKDHPVEQIIGDIHSAPQTRRMKKRVTDHVEPKKVIQALIDPYGKRVIGTKWVYRNKKDKRVARIEAIKLFLAYASFKDFIVYQMDVKSAFLYGKIEEEVYVCQPPGFEDPEFPDRVYKVEKALYGLHQAPRAWYETLSTYLLDNGFQRGLQVTQKDDGIFISQDKYVDEILKKFGFSNTKTASTPMETSKPLMKDENAEDVDVHLYRSMIGSLMYFVTTGNFRNFK
ncbi:putative ribonuclease H-like domain-containing protein [Tanacetum coccineum]